MVKVSPTHCTRPVGERKVSGGKRHSLSFGKADSHATSAPRSMKLRVTILKMTECGDCE